MVNPLLGKNLSIKITENIPDIKSLLDNISLFICFPFIVNIISATGTKSNDMIKNGVFLRYQGNWFSSFLFILTSFSSPF